MKSRRLESERREKKQLKKEEIRRAAEEQAKVEARKQAQIKESWKKIRRIEWIRKWIQGGCTIAGMVIALIVEIVFYDQLPREMTERTSGYRGRHSMSWVEIMGILLGAGVGWLISRAAIRMMKLEE